MPPAAALGWDADVAGEAVPAEWPVAAGGAGSCVLPGGKMLCAAALRGSPLATASTHASRSNGLGASGVALSLRACGRAFDRAAFRFGFVSIGWNWVQSQCSPPEGPS